MNSYLITAAFILLVVLVGAVCRIIFRVYNLLSENLERERALRLGIPYRPKPGLFEKWWSDANAMVPLEEERRIELDHDYDGIRELDNHLPPWWKGLFYGSIVFAAVYLILFHVSNSLPLPEQEYQNEVVLAEEHSRILNASQPPEAIDLSKLGFTNDAAIIAKGKAIFVSSNCAACHRNDGGGNTIGPNLTDRYWLHGGDIKDVFTTINTGVVEKAMPAWGKVMSQTDVKSLAFYVMSLQGTNPPDAKAPQGKRYEPKGAATDSTKMQAGMKP